MRLTDPIRSLVRRSGFDIVRYHESVRSKPLELLRLFIRDALDRTPDFFLVQIGAHDGVRMDDPVRPAVERYQIGALLVEPLPDLFEALKHNYASHPQVRFAKCAVGTANGTQTFYRIRADAPLPKDAQGLASFDRRNLTTERQGVPGLDAHIESIEVDTVTLPDLLERFAVPRVDALVVDAEGFDATIVNAALDAGLRPELLLYESVHLSRPQQNDLLKRLIAAGYRFVEVGLDTYACRV
jgi:FkbM family methyltransferase